MRGADQSDVVSEGSAGEASPEAPSSTPPDTAPEPPEKLDEAPATQPAHGGVPCGRNAASPWSIPLAGWSDVLWRARKELNDDHVVVVAAGVAFFGLFALVPAIGVVVSVYGLLADPRDAAEHLEAFSEVMPAAGASLVRSTLAAAIENSKSSLSVRAIVGIALALWSSSRGMRSLLRALTIAYDEDPSRGWVHERALSYGFTAGAITVMALTIGIVVAVPPGLVYLGVTGTAGAAVRWLRWPLFMLLSCGSLATLYRYGPSRKPPKWRWTIVGSLVATGLWLLGSSVLSIYVRHIEYLDASYGPLGAFMVLMLWCFISSFAILLGAELNAELEHQTEIDTTTGPARPRGERGAFVADNVGRCRPRLSTMVKEQLSRARAVAKPLVERQRKRRAARRRPQR